MNMKKEYIKPTANIMELEYTGMLCAASGIETVTPKVDSTDPVKWPVHKDPYDGEDRDII